MPMVGYVQAKQLLVFISPSIWNCKFTNMLLKISLQLKALNPILFTQALQTK
jgi:hypothetical protein